MLSTIEIPDANCDIEPHHGLAFSMDLGDAPAAERDSENEFVLLNSEFASRSLLPLENVTTTQNDYENESSSERIGVSLIANLLSGLADPLFLKSRHMDQSLKSFIGGYPASSAHKTGEFKIPMDSKKSMRYLQFFSPSNIRRFLKTFWDDWYPHCPDSS